jgi:hypothetical protein
MLWVVEGCVAAIEVAVDCVWGTSVTEENKPECQLGLANTKGFECELRVSVHLVLHSEPTPTFSSSSYTYSAPDT